MVLAVGTGKVFTCLNIIYELDGSLVLALVTGKVFTCLNIELMMGRSHFIVICFLLLGWSEGVPLPVEWVDLANCSWVRVLVLVKICFILVK